MTNSPPPIDTRTAAQVTQRVTELLATYVPNDGSPPLLEDPIQRALVGVFARFCDLIIQRLNQVPQKNFLAFLNLLGASRLPPQPARVPLTFSLAAGSAVDGIVPAGTQVAAPPLAGEAEPILFETERELVVTAAQLEAIWSRNPETDTIANYSHLANGAIAKTVPIFIRDREIDHILYIAHDTIFADSALKAIRIIFTLKERVNIPADTVQWEYWNGTEYVAFLPPISPQVNGVQISVIIGNESLPVGSDPSLPTISPTSVNGQTHRWIRGRWKFPILPGPEQTGLPEVTAIRIQPTFRHTGLLIQSAFANQSPIADLTKEFYPFGQTPQLGDTLYLTAPEAFSKKAATITLNVRLTLMMPPITGVASPTINPVLAWEYWNGQAWTSLITSLPSGRPASEGFRVDSLTTSGQVQFVIPNEMMPTTINGVETYWIRVRLSSGNYGTEGRYTRTSVTIGQGTLPVYTFEIPQFAPPLIHSLTINSSLSPVESSNIISSNPDAVVADNDGNYTDVTRIAIGKNPEFRDFKPFHPTQAIYPSLYLGFTLPASRRTFPNRPLGLFCQLSNTVYEWSSSWSLPSNNNLSAGQANLSWHFWNGSDWEKLAVNDQTEQFTRSGLIEFLLPATIAPRTDFGRSCYWLRVQWEGGAWKTRQYATVPQIRHLLLNTTIAAQTVTHHQEILGSSNGSEHQTVRTTQFPVLAGQVLQVREPERPSSEELTALYPALDPSEMISEVLDGAGRPREIWVRWQEVPDFYGSGPRDRHYVLNHLTGEIRFGDGINGLIPPIGTGNLRMTHYQTGGGQRGNRSAGAIVQMKTTLPYIDKVTNPEPAMGGADAESLDSLMTRAPRSIRHRDRAVTIEDYEDLAILASPAVARAKCVPLRNLAANPLQAEIEPGEVSVMIVPNSTEVKPLPSLELMRRVEDYLQTHSLPTLNVSVVGPLYVEVQITAELGLVSLEGASEVEKMAIERLTNFLHPLTGGFEGTGWEFGREPQKSDFYRLLESVPGVDHVRSLQVMFAPIYDTYFKATQRFLVYSGAHTITLHFGGSG